MEIWQYEGEPTQEEIIQREPYYKDDHLAIRPKCPMCEGRNTAWIRQEWYVCFGCLISFTSDDSIGYCDMEAYNADPRVEQEILLEVYNEG